MKILDDAYENYLKMMDGTDFPDCFESKAQFETWSSMESIAHTKPRALPCRDCTRSYRRMMIEENRCANGSLPGVVKLFQKA